MTGMARSTRAAGYGSAVAATVFSIGYSVVQVGEWTGLLGSGGGAENPSTALGIVLLLTPSLFLGSAFLVLMASLHQATPPERQVWSQAAMAFSTAYAVLTGMVYFAQLTFVMPRMVQGRVQGMEMFLFTPYDSFLYATDILGYSFMSVATLFAAGALPGGGVNRVARGFLIANGLLVPFIALQMYVHELIWLATPWALTFPGATWSLAVMFRRARTTGA